MFIKHKANRQHTFLSVNGNTTSILTLNKLLREQCRATKFKGYITFDQSCKGFLSTLNFSIISHINKKNNLSDLMFAYSKIKKKS